MQSFIIPYVIVVFDHTNYTLHFTCTQGGYQFLALARNVLCVSFVKCVVDPARIHSDCIHSDCIQQANPSGIGDDQIHNTIDNFFTSLLLFKSRYEPCDGPTCQNALTNSI